MAKLKPNVEPWKMAIRVLTEECLITQKELAKKLNVSGQSVSNWMNDVRNPSIYSKRRLMELLKESQAERRKDDSFLFSMVPKPKEDKEGLTKLLSGMTDAQIRKLIKTAEKMGK